MPGSPYSMTGDLRLGNFPICLICQPLSISNHPFFLQNLEFRLSPVSGICVIRAEFRRPHLDSSPAANALLLHGVLQAFNTFLYMLHHSFLISSDVPSALMMISDAASELLASIFSAPL